MLVLSIQAEAESLLPCSDLHVQYSDPQVVPLKGRVVVKELEDRPADVLPESDHEFKPYSSQRMAAFNRVHIADTTKPGPWNNSIQVFTVSGPSHAWQIDTYDMRDNARLEWINDDLIFVQIWWGRIVSSDLIFQISTGKFIYAQEANYGFLTQPCE